MPALAIVRIPEVSRTKLPPIFLLNTQTHNLRGHGASSMLSSGLHAYLEGPRHTLSNRNSRQTSNIIFRCSSKYIFK